MYNIGLKRSQEQLATAAPGFQRTLSQRLLQYYRPLRSSFTKLVPVKVTSVFTYP